MFPNFTVFPVAQSFHLMPFAGKSYGHFTKSHEYRLFVGEVDQSGLGKQ
jgi:hypothetical protein